MKFYGPFENDEEVSMNMTPMIDVVFLMTIFFLASAALSVGGQDSIELPTASEARLAKRLNPDSITINIEAVGGGAAFAVSGRGYSYGELLRKLQTMAEAAQLLKKPPPPIILRADFRVPYKYVQQLMFDCAAMGIQVFDFQAVGGEEISR